MMYTLQHDLEQFLYTSSIFYIFCHTPFISLCIMKFAVLTLLNSFGTAAPIVGSLDGAGVLHSSAGPIRGVQYGQTYTGYYSIPFAEPPVGGLRWAPPAPLKTPWNSTRNAFFPAVSCTASVVGTQVQYSAVA